MSKTLKNGTPPLRACVTALCLIMDVKPRENGQKSAGQDIGKLKVHSVSYELIALHN